LDKARYSITVYILEIVFGIWDYIRLDTRRETTRLTITPASALLIVWI
jgi:hypothetical protein